MHIEQYTKYIKKKPIDFWYKFNCIEKFENIFIFHKNYIPVSIEIDLVAKRKIFITFFTCNLIILAKLHFNIVGHIIIDDFLINF